ncbi:MULTISPECIES: HD domain-containing protein [Clostridium]|uniref:HD domain-containing protein n=1 Tax=Clostridium TaxID=1485 RepID=UPI000825762C|nr:MULTISPECIES: HD domain-containing protein [Clostridium]PJI08047.1 CCA tRNA nucleotidyltransferase [Clostridium sp. CT7]
MREIIKLVKSIICNTDIQAYLVGGYIRDKLINIKNEPNDLDIVLSGNIEKVLDVFQEKGFKVFVLRGECNIYRATLNNYVVDISEMKGQSIEEDLLKRDFTANAIALDLRNNKIIDPLKGRLHIKRRILQSVDEDSFKDDPVRILRGIRFYIKYGMHFSGYTEEYIRSEAKNILKFPADRVLDEFIHGIHDDENGIFFEVMDQYMVLKNILPYMEELKTVGKCKYHLVDAFTHMNTAYHVFKDLQKGIMQVKNLDIEIFNKKIGIYDESDYLAFATFVHDIGKYVSYKKEEDKVSFKGHDEKGFEIIEKVCDKLKFPGDAKKMVCSVVKNHMYPLMLFKLDNSNLKSKTYDFFVKFNKYVPYIITASFCDVYATKMYMDAQKDKDKFKEFISDLINTYENFCDVKNKRLIDGNDLKELGFSGQRIGQVIKELDKQIYLGKVKSRDEQFNFVLEMK